MPERARRAAMRYARCAWNCHQATVGAAISDTPATVHTLIIGNRQNGADAWVRNEGTAMSVKLLATGAAALAAIGAASAGVTSVAPGTSNSPAGPAVFPVRPAAVAAPLPLDPPPPAPPPGPNPPAPPGAPVALPSPDQLAGLCTQATDPGVSYTNKTSLVENGISPGEGHVADHDLRKAYRDGKFPESFNVTNIQPAGPNMVSADVAISGPKFAGPVTKHLVFVNQNGNWLLQHDAALALLQAATA
jgi:hypothetical protein